MHMVRDWGITNHLRSSANHAPPNQTVPYLIAGPHYLVAKKSTGRMIKNFSFPRCNTLSEPGRAATHNFTLADELGVEFRAVEREVDVEVDTVEGALGCVHPFEVFLEVLLGQVGGEGDDFLDA